MESNIWKANTKNLNANRLMEEIKHSGQNEKCTEMHQIQSVVKNQSNNSEEEKTNEKDDNTVDIRIDMKDEYFQVEHFISNAFVIILGVESYMPDSAYKSLPGVKKDVEAMRILFNDKLKFVTKVLSDYTKNEYFSAESIKTFLNVECARKIEQQDDKQEYDGLICIVSGHGIADFLICGDGKPLEIKTNLITRFGSDLLQQLKHYPKIFIFDICRGNNPANEFTKEITEVRGKNSRISLNTESGYRISYSTSQGKTAPQSESGGKFIQAFNTVMLHLFEHEILHENDFQTILRMSSQKATKKTNLLCPVHEDYTVYKLYFQCKYSSNQHAYDNEYKIKSELNKLFDKQGVTDRNEQLKIIERLLPTESKHDNDKEIMKLKTMSSLSLMDYTERRTRSMMSDKERKKHQLQEWLQEAGYGEYYELFSKQKYKSLDDLMKHIHTTDKLEKEVGIPFAGHRDKLLDLIQNEKIKQEKEQINMKRKRVELQQFLEDVGLSQHYEKLIQYNFVSLDKLRKVEMSTRMPYLKLAIDNDDETKKLVECVKIYHIDMDRRNMRLRFFLSRHDVGLVQYMDDLRENGFQSVDDLRDVDEQTFKDVIKLTGHRTKLVKCVKREYEWWGRLRNCCDCSKGDQEDSSCCDTCVIM
eukprot:41332_1